MSLIITRPEPTEYAGYFARYIDQTSTVDLIPALINSHEELCTIVKGCTEPQLLHRYAEGKWSVKELLVHLSDAERIFAYRALRFVRRDTTLLPGFDENLYVPASHADERTPEVIIRELYSVRQATITLFEAMNEEDLRQTGTASNTTLSVRALGYIILGHETHHRTILRERYGL